MSSLTIIRVFAPTRPLCDGPSAEDQGVGNRWGCLRKDINLTRSRVGQEKLFLFMEGHTQRDMTLTIDLER